MPADPTKPDDPPFAPTVVRPTPLAEPGAPTVAHTPSFADRTAAVTDATGRYEIGELIAQGGMGAVYAAHDTVLRRGVAVKVLRSGGANSAAAARFRAEARITGQLQHPGVPPVHELGTLSDGGPFLAMKLIKGETLAVKLNNRPTPAHDLPRFLQAFEQICHTVGFAHSRHVIHRDLKPTNIMVGAFGEVQVMDWGLAKVVDAAGMTNTPREDVAPETHIEPGRDDGGSDTQAGSVVGTPGYMPPEQARGEPADARADVFSLGAVLCEILTGSPPYTGSRVEVRAKSELGHMTEAFARLDGCGAEPVLVALAKRCLDAAPAARPANAGAVAEAVLAFRADAERRAHQAELDRARAEEKAVEQRKRRRVQLALLAAVALLALAGGGFAWWTDRQAEDKKLRQAEFEREQARFDAEQARLEADRARVAGELKAAEERAAAEQREQTLKARARTDELIRLANDLRKQFKFKAARAALEQASAVAASAPELKARVEQESRNLALVARLDEIRLTKFRLNGGKFDPSAVNTRFAACFAEYGFDILKGNPDDLARQLRASAVQSDLINALDDWGMDDSRDEVRRRIWDLTAEVTGQPWRRQVLDARDRPEKTEAVLARIPPDQITPALLVNLGFYQFVGGGDGIGVIRRGLLRFPDDFWHHYNLGLMTSFTPGRGAEALGHYRAALALRPDDPLVWMAVQGGLTAIGDTEGAALAGRKVRELDPTVAAAAASPLDVVANFNPAEVRKLVNDLLASNPNFASGWGLLALIELREGNLKAAETAAGKALRLDPRSFASVQYEVGRTWAAKGDAVSSERCHRELVRLAPWFALAHDALGVLASRRGDFIGARDAFREAARLEPTNATTRGHLAEAFAKTGSPDAAEKEARAAIQLAPTHPDPLCSLGAVQFSNGNVEAAIDTFREVTRVHPKHAYAHDWLCYLQIGTGDFKDAVASGTEAVRWEPTVSQYHYNLGRAKLGAGDRTGGYAALRKVIALFPNQLDAHALLGRSLASDGLFTEALPHLKKWQELSPPAPPGQLSEAARLVRDCEAMILVSARFTEVRTGKSSPKDTAERFAFARLCLLYEKRYAEAVRFYREGFKADQTTLHPRTTLRYNAARAATLAAAGQGTDPVSPEKRGEYRATALAWLTDDLATLKLDFVVRPSSAREFVHSAVTHWLRDATFAAVRHPLYLAALPPDEAKRWLALWADVQQLREATTVPIAPPPRAK